MVQGSYCYYFLLSLQDNRSDASQAPLVKKNLQCCFWTTRTSSPHSLIAHLICYDLPVVETLMLGGKKGEKTERGKRRS